MAGPAYVIGIGNPDRGDDGAGRAVAAYLRERVSDSATVLEHNGEVSDLLERLEAAEAVYLVDAAASGATPGTIHRLDAHDGPLPGSLFALSTHGFGPGEAVELARAMGSLPRICVIYAIEGANFEAGAPLSDAVAAASCEVVERLLAELEDPSISAKGGDGHA